LVKTYEDPTPARRQRGGRQPVRALAVPCRVHRSSCKRDTEVREDRQAAQLSVQ
jgi:hypothetical protein